MCMVSAPCKQVVVPSSLDQMIYHLSRLQYKPFDVNMGKFNDANLSEYIELYFDRSTSIT